MREIQQEAKTLVDRDV